MGKKNKKCCCREININMTISGFYGHNVQSKEEIKDFESFEANLKKATKARKKMKEIREQLEKTIKEAENKALKRFVRNPNEWECKYKAF